MCFNRFLKSNDFSDISSKTIDWNRNGIFVQVLTPSSEEAALQFGADPAMHPHSGPAFTERSPRDHSTPIVEIRSAKMQMRVPVSSCLFSSDVSCLGYPWRLRRAQYTPFFFFFSKKIRSKCHSIHSIFRVIVLDAFSRDDLEELLAHNLTGESRSSR